MITRVPRPAVYLLPLGCLLLLAAAPLPHATPESLIRQANAAFLAGDIDQAERLYSQAEEQTADPGLVAFNRAAILFQQQDYRAAEEHYTRVLDDAACPADRAARAWYNRGTCLLLRGGSLEVYRSAIAALERCVDSPAADEPLKADARHNLELAKKLWNNARATQQKNDSPNNAPPPEEQPNAPPTLDKPDTKSDNRPPEKTQDQPGVPAKKPKAGEQPAPKPIGERDPKQTATQPDPNAPALRDESSVQSFSAADTREHLRRIAERLRKDRHDLLRTLYPPEQPGGRDW